MPETEISAGLPTIDPNIEISEKKRTAESYLPKGYPRLLFQGTSLSNARRSQENGLGAGTFTTFIIDSFDHRFYRPTDGVILITPHDPNIFNTKKIDDPDSFRPSQFYSLRPDTGPHRIIKYTNVDTDQVTGDEVEVETTSYVPPEKTDCIRLTDSQRNFIVLIDSILRGRNIGNFDQAQIKLVEGKLLQANIPLDKVNDLDVYAPFKIGVDPMHLFNYQQYQEQVHTARLLGIQTGDMKDWDSYQRALNALYPTEDDFISKVVLPNFPGEVEWVWNHLTETQTSIVAQIVLQLYQNRIVGNITALVNQQTEGHFVEFPKGESVTGLLTLRSEQSSAGLTNTPTDKDIKSIEPEHDTKVELPIHPPSKSFSPPLD